MDNSFAKVLSFAAFIVLGWILRRVGILKPEAFSAISGLVLNVTIPAVIITPSLVARSSRRILESPMAQAIGLF